MYPPIHTNLVFALIDRPTPRFPPGLNIDQDHTPAPLFSGQGQRPVFRDPARYFIGDPLGDPYFDKDEEEGPGRGQGRKAHTGRVRFTEAVQTKAEWELGFGKFMSDLFSVYRPISPETVASGRVEGFRSYHYLYLC